MINIAILFVNSFFKDFTNFIEFTQLWELLPVASDGAHASGIHTAYADPVPLGTGMDDHAVPYVDPHMSVIADHISRLLVRIADRPASHCQRAGLPGHGDTEMGVNQIDEARTVRTVGQAVPSIYIRASDELLPIGSDGTAQSAATARRAPS